MVLGGVKKGGSGCICPESVLLRTLITHLVLFRDEVVVMDMEAGIEHLGRGTARSVDKLIVVVEPGRRSIETAHHVLQLAKDIGISKVVLVGNKIRGPEDQDFLEKNLSELKFLGFLPFDNKVIESDLKGAAPYDLSPESLAAAKEIGDNLSKMQ
jgi:CO dehydrogenase maturation factor